MIRFCRGSIKPAQEFLQTHASLPGKHVVELHAVVRPTGRINEASKLALGGDVLNVDVDMFDVIPDPKFTGWRLQYQVWPADIKIRKNLVSSGWKDAEALVVGRDATVLDDQGSGIPANEFLTVLSEIQPVNAAAVRWAVVLGDDNSLQLQLQGLPASAPTINSKPTLRK